MPDTEYLSGVVIPIVTFIAGFALSRFSMTKAERREDSNRSFKLAESLMEKMEATFQEFAAALKTYIDSGTPTFDHFYAISTSGEKYLYQVKITCDAILTENVDPIVRDETLVPKIKDCANRTLPDLYATLQHIAEKKGFEYSGKLQREKYLSIYTVAEKYWPVV